MLSRSSLPAFHKLAKNGKSRRTSLPPYSELSRFLPSNSRLNADSGTMSSMAPAPTTMTSPPRRVACQADMMDADLPTTSKP